LLFEDYEIKHTLRRLPRSGFVQRFQCRH